MSVCVAQLTDCHLGSGWERDPAEALGAVIDAVLTAAGDALLAVLITGDIAHAGRDDEYEAARAQLRRLAVPLVVTPGNHDDRARLAEHFALPATGRPDLSHALDLGAVRVVALDTQRPGHDGGQFDAERADWLAATLAQDTTTPTILAMHHPPLVTGIPVMDAIGLADGERAALGTLLSAHPQVRTVVAGHVHRTISGRLGAVPILAVPSTSAQLALDFAAEDFTFTAEPPGFALHRLVDGEFVSHVGVLPG